jgi:hypothetical protein
MDSASQYWNVGNSTCVKLWQITGQLLKQYYAAKYLFRRTEICCSKKVGDKRVGGAIQSYATNNVLRNIEMEILYGVGQRSHLVFSGFFSITQQIFSDFSLLAGWIYITQQYCTANVFCKLWSDPLIKLKCNHQLPLSMKKAFEWYIATPTLINLVRQYL